MELADDAHLAAVMQATQLDAQRRRQRRQCLRDSGRRPLRLRLAAALVRAGLRIGEPLTGECLLAGAGRPGANTVS